MTLKKEANNLRKEKRQATNNLRKEKRRQATLKRKLLRKAKRQAASKEKDSSVEKQKLVALIDAPIDIFAPPKRTKTKQFPKEKSLSQLPKEKSHYHKWRATQKTKETNIQKRARYLETYNADGTRKHT